MAVSILKGTAKIDSAAVGYGLTDEDFDVTYLGAVLDTFERNGYDDSDFYAVVWTGEEVRAIEWGTTRGWTYANSAQIDATDEVKAAAGAYLAARDIESWNAAAAHDALMIEKGSIVEVFKGRKVPVGTTGEVIWIGADRYKRGADRIGIKDADGEVHWTAADNARVTDGAERITGLDEIIQTTTGRILRLIKGEGSWASAYRSYGGNVMGMRFSVGAGQVNDLLAETGRDKIDGAALYAAAAADYETRKAEAEAADAEFNAELDKPKGERDAEKIRALALRMGESAEVADALVAAATRTTGDA